MDIDITENNGQIIEISTLGVDITTSAEQSSITIDNNNVLVGVTSINSTAGGLTLSNGSGINIDFDGSNNFTFNAYPLTNINGLVYSGEWTTQNFLINNGATSYLGSALKFVNEGERHYTIGLSGSNFIIADTSDNGNSVWGGSPTSLFIVDGYNNIGIGTNNPVGKLDISGNIYASGGKVITQSDLNSSPRLLIGSGNPEGILSAISGSIYTDWSTSTLYKKITGSNVNGWVI